VKLTGWLAGSVVVDGFVLMLLLLRQAVSKKSPDGGIATSTGG
jgi:hypothetical protein